MSTLNNKLILRSVLVGTCAILCVAIVARAQYNTFDSDSNSDSDGNPILTQSELGKMVRNSAKAHGGHRLNHHQQAAASRNLHNRQQPLQYSPTQHRRNYGPVEGSNLNDFGPMNLGTAASSGRGSNADGDSDDDESNSYGPNFGSNFDNSDAEGERGDANPEGRSMGLEKAASGYPGHGDYNEGAGAGFGFGGPSSYGSSEGSEFGPSEGFGGEGSSRAKSASSPLGSRGYGSDEDSGATQYGPNSAINGGDADDDSRSSYSPEGQGDNDNDDE